MKCNYCNTEIEGSYYEDSWGHVIHPEHIKSSTRCGSCLNIVMPNSSPRPKVLLDGRVICGNCLSEAILEEWQMMKCFQAVYEFYKMGHIHFSENKINYELVEATSLPSDAFGQVLFIDGSYLIKILRGLNKTICCGIISHELMHVHLKELGIELSLQEEEGICEIANYCALKMVGTKHAQSRIKSMEDNEDVIYGVGFRLMKERVKRYGSIQKYLQTLKC